MRRFGSRSLRAIKGALLTIAVAASVPLAAQQIKPLDVERDPNGVELFNGKVAPKLPTLSIPAAPNLTFRKLSDFLPFVEGTEPGGSDTGSRGYSVNAGGFASEGMKCIDYVCTSAKGSGSVMGGGGWVGPLHYVQGGTGIKIIFTVRTKIQTPPLAGDAFFYLASKIQYPNGEVLTFVYDEGVSSTPGISYKDHRPSTVTSNLGYRLNFTYEENVYVEGDGNWTTLSRAEIVSTANPSVALAAFDYTDTAATDLAGRVYECSNCQNSLSGSQPAYTASLKLPDETTNSFSVTHTDTVPGHKLDVSSDGVDYDYNFVYDTSHSEGPNNVVDDVTVTGPDGFYRYVDIHNIGQFNGICHVTNYSSCTIAAPRQRIDSVTDSQGNTTAYEYDVGQRVIKIIYPELNSMEVKYDISGNITELRQKAKPTSSAPDVVQTAYYDSSFECGAITCYLPEWTKDANGNQTDYVWSPAHGGLITQLDPINEQNQRRMVSYTYVKVPTGPWRLTEEEICAANAAGTPLTCGTSASQVRLLAYINNTLLVESETLTDGAGNAPLTTTMTYDDAGRLLSSDGPLPASDDATYARYDVIGRKVWDIGPKGENGLRPATRTTFRDADDKPLKVENGTVAGNTTALSPTNLAFVELISEANTNYNSRRLAIESRVSAGGSDYSVTQMSYDARNREQCSAIRMNAAVWMSLPTSACTLGATGNEGPDRISQKHYDTESRVIRIEQGIGTSLVRDYATYSFTPNGQMASMTDARGYKASMMYDGFDRQTYWYFPNPNVTGAINASDYEQYSYDANGNRTTLRKRDGSVLAFTYDKLNRITKKTVPTRAGLDTTHSRDVFYRYDIRGLQTHAKFDSIGGHGLFILYDRYGRVARNDDNMDGVMRRLYYYYNAAGNRTRLRYPDAKNVHYTYTSGGQFNQIKDHGNVVIADYDYNNRGELSQVNRDSTAPDQDWTYDPMGRLASTGWGNGGASNVTWSFTRNSASQIKTETQTNDGFSWDSHVDVTRNYTTNGLNQYTAVSGQSYCYDSNGNLTADGQYAYLYDVENRLVEMRAQANSVCTSLAYTGQLKAKLRYDPLGRLHEVEGFVFGVTQGVKRFLYDGDALVAEYSGANAMLARYIHGPAGGADDPLVEYLGSGVAASNRTNLYADARGSIVLRTDTAGSNAVINTYDEYGIPGSTNAGRFQYTGQVWLPELGMNYYKARMYSPVLGRFMQTDPIGYEDNVNLYGYVANDPINGVDPLGMYACGSNLSEGQCERFEKVQDAAIKHVETRIATLEGAQETLANGGELNDAQSSALSDLNDFFGTSGDGAKGIETAISSGNAILGEFKGDKPAFLGDTKFAAESVLRGRVLELGRSFFGSGMGSHDRVFTLAHEAAHTSGIAPKDFGSNIRGGPSIGPYGMRNAILRGTYAPSSTTRHPDSIPYALGFRRNKR